MRARKPGTLMRRAKGDGGIEAEKRVWTLLLAARDELRKMAREGIVDADAADKYHPVRTIIRIENDPSTPPVIRLAAAKEILQYVEAPKSAVMRLDAADAAGGPSNITLVIQSWAAAGKPAPALPGPETIIERGTPQNNSTPAAPTMSDRERLRRQVAAQRETVIIEAPASPSEPAHVIGRVNQGRPYELSADEKQQIMERLKKGNENHQENHQMLFPELQRDRRD
jgi:hypothetical protein